LIRFVRSRYVLTLHLKVIDNYLTFICKYQPQSTMKNFISGAFLLCSLACFSQKTDTVKTENWENIYRASAAKINDLVHTKLDVRFDYSRSWMYGKAWITLHPHFYTTDSLNLNAKGMTIHEVSMIKSGKHFPLKYSYDSRNLRIILDKSYRGGENYTVYIDYISKPDEIRENGSSKPPLEKGLFFIDKFKQSFFTIKIKGVLTAFLKTIYLSKLFFFHFFCFYKKYNPFFYL